MHSLAPRGHALRRKPLPKTCASPYFSPDQAGRLRAQHVQFPGRTALHHLDTRLPGTQLAAMCTQRAAMCTQLAVCMYPAHHHTYPAHHRRGYGPCGQQGRLPLGAARPACGQPVGPVQQRHSAQTPGLLGPALLAPGHTAHCGRAAAPRRAQRQSAAVSGSHASCCGAAVRRGRESPTLWLPIPAVATLWLSTPQARGAAAAGGVSGARAARLHRPPQLLSRASEEGPRVVACHVSVAGSGRVALGPRGTSTRVVFGGGRGMNDTLHTPPTPPPPRKTDAWLENRALNPQTTIGSLKLFFLDLRAVIRVNSCCAK